MSPAINDAPAAPAWPRKLAATPICPAASPSSGEAVRRRMQLPVQVPAYRANVIFRWRQQPSIHPSRQGQTGPLTARISQLYANLANIAKPVRIRATASIARDALSAAIRLIVGKFSCAKLVFRTISRIPVIRRQEDTF